MPIHHTGDYYIQESKDRVRMILLYHSIANWQTCIYKHQSQVMKDLSRIRIPKHQFCYPEEK